MKFKFYVTYTDLWIQMININVWPSLNIMGKYLPSFVMYTS